MRDGRSASSPHSLLTDQTMQSSHFSTQLRLYLTIIPKMSDGNEFCVARRLTLKMFKVAFLHTNQKLKFIMIFLELKSHVIVVEVQQAKMPRPSSYLALPALPAVTALAHAAQKENTICECKCTSVETKIQFIRSNIS